MRPLSPTEFADRIAGCSPEPLARAAIAALFTHHRLLLRWNERTSLIGPGTVEQLVEIHYGESLAALPLLGDGAGRTVVDIGSGAGFPGVVLAAARPSMGFVLVEARERKWSFLKAVAAETGLGYESLLGTVDRSLPPGFPARVDYVTLRALKLPARAWRPLGDSLAETARVLIWAGREDPSIPPKLRVCGGVDLSGTHSKRILELDRAEG
jgi:16S rRNA (guanine(527)-N(7))-methyltransferase RsmG